MVSYYNPNHRRLGLRATRTCSWLGWSVSVALGAGCGPNPDEYPLLRPDAGYPTGSVEPSGPAVDNIIEDDPLEDWDMTDAGPLSGIFAAEVRIQANVVVDLESRQLARIRLLQRGRELRLRAQTCRLGLPSVQGVADLAIPLSLEMLFRSKASELQGDYLSAESAVGAAFEPPEMVTVLGATLGNPLTDPLPTTSNPTSAVDEDGDGQLGVTLDATTMLCPEKESLYIALRTVVRLSGTVTSTDLIAGEVGRAGLLDQSVLGYSADCMATAAGLAITILEGNTFQARRVGLEYDVNGNGNVTCGEIVQAAPELFGAYWSGVSDCTE